MRSIPVIRLRALSALDQSVAHPPPKHPPTCRCQGTGKIMRSRVYNGHVAWVRETCQEHIPQE